MSLTIKIKYLDPDMPRITEIEKGDWIDLYTREDIPITTGIQTLINLGVIIQLPEGYEAILAPRSSTFKKFGVLQTNSIGVIDNSYRGPDDVWMMPVFGTRDIVIPKHTRIAQFRIIENQPKVNIVEINDINEESRGGFGSTGSTTITINEIAIMDKDHNLVLNLPKRTKQEDMDKESAGLISTAVIISNAMTRCCNDDTDSDYFGWLLNEIMSDFYDTSESKISYKMPNGINLVINII